MLILIGICQYDGKYATLNRNIRHFLDHHRARFMEKSPRHRNITISYTNWYNAVLGFSPKNALGEGPATKESKNMVDYFEVQGALWRATSKDHPLLHYRDRKFISKYFARLYSTWNSYLRHPGSAASFLLVQDVSEIEQKAFFDKKIRFVFRKYKMTRGCYP